MKSVVVFAIVLLVANISHATKMDTTEVSIGDFSGGVGVVGSNPATPTNSLLFFNKLVLSFHVWRGFESS